MKTPKRDIVDVLPRHASAVITLFVLLGVGACGKSSAAGFHVTTTGTPGGIGSLVMPWDLQTALNQPTAVQPGDTIFVHGGKYAPDPATKSFNVRLSGTADHPVIVRNFEDERVVLFGLPDPASSVLVIQGAIQYTWFWGLELMGSGTDRLSHVASSNPSDIDLPSGVSTQQESGPIVGIKFINMIVHDVSGGYAWWKDSRNSEVYGNVIFNIGWDGPDRGHGHGIYVQNESGTKTISDNIIFGGFSHGIHAYGSPDARLDSMEITGNILFGAGALSSVDRYGGRNMLVGGLGDRRATGDSIISNHVYFDPNTGGGESVNIGYLAGSDGAYLAGNWITNRSSRVSLNMSNDTNSTLLGNRLYGAISGFNADDFPVNEYSPNVPLSGDTVFVRRNKYDPNRAHVVVYNWGKSPSVVADVSSVLGVGGPYTLYNAQNPYGDQPVVGVNSNGTIEIPMSATRWSQAPPRGWPSATTTFPEFGAFVLVSGAPPAPPEAPVLLSPPNKAVAQPAALTLRWGMNRTVTSCHLQIAVDPLFSAMIVDDSTVAGSYEMVGPLAFDAVYFWRVKCKNGGGSSQYSEVRSFAIRGPLRAGVKVYLEGPYDANTHLMSKKLNSSGVLRQQYQDVTVPSDAVDIITVEVRDSAAASRATIRKSVTAWLLSNGTVRDSRDTTKTLLDFDAPEGSYFIVVSHRNHLRVMSGTAQYLSETTGPMVFDFTAMLASGYGINPMKSMPGGLYALWGGDVDASGAIDVADRMATWNQRNKVGYLGEDVDLSGVVDVADRNISWNNRNIFCKVPE